MNPVIRKIRTMLRAAATDAGREKSLRFFKEPRALKLHGVPFTEVSRFLKALGPEIKGFAKPEMFALCETLWLSGYLEERFVACELAYTQRRSFARSDIGIFATWTEIYVDNWAICDTLCNHSVGDLVMMFPRAIADLLAWAKMSHTWLKRGAAVSLIIPARKGLFLEEILAIADILHADAEDMVQKGYGWMLKAASQAYPEEIFAYVMTKKATMPRTALRYAIEKLPPERRKQAMAK